MQRRNFVKLTLLSTLASNILAKENTIRFYKEFSKKLIIPSILEAKISNNNIKEFHLNLQEGSMDFFEGKKTKTYGINSDFLGPTIRVNNKDRIKIHVKNSLKEPSSMHWHGLHLEGHNDGGPNRKIKTNQSWSTEFLINQKSATYWYHPHTHKETGSQVYKGLAGLFLIEDEDSHKAKIPKEYGFDDIPLIVQDRRFDNKAQFLYKYSMHDEMMGVKGKVFLVNGVIQPYIELKAKSIRFRLLNASNARFYNFTFSNNQEFYQIAGDASFLEKSIKLKNLLLGPGERAEILIDLSSLQNQSLYLLDALSQEKLMKIYVKNEKNETFVLPSSFTEIKEYKNIKKLSTLKIRTFTLDMSMMKMGINGKKMSMDYINEKVILKEKEIWRLINPKKMPHTFHIHGCSFKILSRNNKAAFLNEAGLKDTVILFAEETVDVLVQFNYTASKKYPFMYHCHILEHEDAGMMGQFTVEEA